MKGSMLSTNGRVLVAALLALAVLFPAHCLPSPPQQPIIPNASEAQRFTTSPSDSQQPALREKRTAKVPILVYHHVSQSISEGRSSALRRLTVTSEIFAQQM